MINMKATKRKTKLRLLCLHGYRQDGDTFSKRIGALRYRISSRCCWSHTVQDSYFVSNYHNILNFVPRVYFLPSYGIILMPKLILVGLFRHPLTNKIVRFRLYSDPLSGYPRVVHLHNFYSPCLRLAGCPVMIFKYQISP